MGEGFVAFGYKILMSFLLFFFLSSLQQEAASITKTRIVHPSLPKICHPVALNLET